MKIKLATWNMAYWSHKAYQTEAWDYFLEKLNCDIILFQESFPKSDKLDPNRLVWDEIGGTRPWGSGVYSSKYNIEKIKIDTEFIGSITAAEVAITEDFKLIVISVYGLMEEILNVSYAIPNLHRIFSDLTGLLEGRTTKNRVVIGGDLNASLQIDQQQVGNSHKVFFDRLREFQLVNCFEKHKHYPDFVQTLRHSRSDKPWQNDYFFISKKLEKSLEKCEVVSNETVHKLSDHNPVVIELDFSQFRVNP